MRCTKQISKNQKTCDRCGSKELDIITNTNSNDEYYAFGEMVADILNDLSFWEKEQLLCSKRIEMRIKGSKDSDGNSSLSAGVHGSDDERNMDFDFSIKQKKDPEGKTTTEVEGSVGIGY